MDHPFSYYPNSKLDIEQNIITTRFYRFLFLSQKYVNKRQLCDLMNFSFHI